MLTLCKIDGKSYDVLISAIEETYNVIEGANSGIAIANQREIRDILGVKIGHIITFSPGDDPDTFDELKDYLFSSIRHSVMLEVAYNQSTITYEAAYNTGARRVAYINDDNNVIGWDDLTVEFRPIELQITE